MNAIAARWESEQLRLWTGSAFAALLMHLVPVVLLVLYIHWSQRPPPQAGSPAALNVDLASLPPAASPTESSRRQVPSQPQTKPAAAGRSLAAVNPVRPLGQMQSIPQPAAIPPNAASVPDAGAINAPAESPDLGASGAPDPGLQLWEDEIVARLASNKEYPSSSLQQVQQDTVMLQISVDHSGRVTYSRVDSPHHYQALEQEVQQMLRLAGRLPAPPPQLAEDAVVTVPVQFSLDIMPNILCGASGCPSGHDAQSKPKAVAPPAPTLASCTAATGPAPAPAGATATLEQMRAYREHLNEYLAAAGNQLACLSQVRETDTSALRDTLTGQLKAMVNDFNAAARAFEARAQAEAQLAQQTRQRQAQALAVQTYATCKLPTAPPAPGSALTAEGAQSYRRQLVGYQSAVRTYVACLREADIAAAASERGLASDQRARLAQTAVQLGDAAIQSFNQVVTGFNAQVPHLRQQALASLAKQNLAEAVVRGTAIFPSSIWDLPRPLPPGECVYITQLGQSYQAQLCNPTYATTVSDLSEQLKNNVNRPNHAGTLLNQIAAVDMKADAASGLPAEALQQEAIAAEHGFPQSEDTSIPTLGIAVTTQTGFSGQVSTGPIQQTTSYSVSDLQIAGRHLSMTIMGRSDNAAGGVDSSVVHYDLVLSPDNQTLRGYCWTGQERQACTLAQAPSSTAVASHP